MASGGEMLAGFVQGFGGSVVGDMEKAQKFELEARGLLLRDALMRRLEGEKQAYQTKEREASQNWTAGEHRRREAARASEGALDRGLRERELERADARHSESLGIQRSNLGLRAREIKQREAEFAAEAENRTARLNGLNADARIKGIQANQAEEMNDLRGKYKSAMEKAAKGDEGAKSEAKLYLDMLNGLAGKIKQNPSITVTPIKQPDGMGGEATAGYILGNDGGAGKYSVYSADELMSGRGVQGVQPPRAPAAGAQAPKGGDRDWGNAYYKPAQRPIPPGTGGVRG